MSPQAGWLLQDQIAPRIAAVVHRSIKPVGCEDAEELTADGIAMAARMVDRTEAQGKLGKVKASNIAYYTLQHLKSGRRAAGSSAVDVHASMTQLQGHVEPHSFSEVLSQSETGDEIFELADVVSTDAEDPSVIAARNLDWQEFAASLTKVEKLIIECLISGQTLMDAAKQARVHYSTMVNYRKKLAAKLLEYMGADILCDIARIPQWRIGLDCDRELLACRAERRN